MRCVVHVQYELQEHTRKNRVYFVEFDNFVPFEINIEAESGVIHKSLKYVLTHSCSVPPPPPNFFLSFLLLLYQQFYRFRSRFYLVVRFEMK
jgi:hypothetical protein